MLAQPVFLQNTSQNHTDLFFDRRTQYNFFVWLYIKTKFASPTEIFDSFMEVF